MRRAGATSLSARTASRTASATSEVSVPISTRSAMARSTVSVGRPETGMTSSRVRARMRSRRGGRRHDAQLHRGAARAPSCSPPPVLRPVRASQAWASARSGGTACTGLPRIGHDLDAGPDQDGRERVTGRASRTHDNLSTLRSTGAGPIRSGENSHAAGLTATCRHPSAGARLRAARWSASVDHAHRSRECVARAWPVLSHSGWAATTRGRLQPRPSRWGGW